MRNVISRLQPWRRIAVLLGAIGVLGLTASADAQEASVHGRVMGQTAVGEHLGPVSGAAVSLKKSGNEVVASTTTDADGYYRFEGVTVGQLAYRIEAVGFRLEDARRRLDITVDGEHVMDFVLTQESPQSTTEPTPADGVINVRVLKENPDGKPKPFAGAQVHFRRTDGGLMVSRTTPPQGRVSNPVAPGSWLVSASAPGVKSVAHPQPIEIAAGAGEAVEITLPAPPEQKPTAPPAPKEKNDGTKAAFYGDVTAAKRVVFVVDKSNSMEGDRFAEASAELMRSVSYLTPDQQFYVIFFSNSMHPMFEPDAPADFIPASADNRARLETFAKDLPHRLGTNAHSSVEKALALKPDVIYLLGDGAFTDDTARFLLNLQGNTIPICTVAFKSQPRGAEVLQRIAERHKGRFVYVP